MFCTFEPLLLVQYLEVKGTLELLRYCSLELLSSPSSTRPQMILKHGSERAIQECALARVPFSAFGRVLSGHIQFMPGHELLILN